MDDLDAMLIGLVDKLGRRLRTGSRVCRTVVLRMRFGDFARATRSHTLAEATAQTGAILLAARGLLSTAAPMIELRGLTLIGISLGNLDDDSAIQLALPFERPQVSALDLTIDSVRERFGSTSLSLRPSCSAATQASRFRCCQTESAARDY